MSTRNALLAAVSLAGLLLGGCDPKSSAGAVGLPKPTTEEKMDPSKMDAKYEPAPKTKLQPQPNPQPKLAPGEASRIDDERLQAQP